MLSEQSYSDDDMYDEVHSDAEKSKSESTESVIEEEMSKQGGSDTESISNSIPSQTSFSRSSSSRSQSTQSCASQHDDEVSESPSPTTIIEPPKHITTTARVTKRRLSPLASLRTKRMPLLRKQFLDETPFKERPIRVWHREAQLLGRISDRDCKISKKVTSIVTRQTPFLADGEDLKSTNPTVMGTATSKASIMAAQKRVLKSGETEGPGPAYLPDTKLTRPQVKNVVFSQQERGSVLWPKNTSESPGPIYSVKMSWSAGTAKQCPDHLTAVSKGDSYLGTPGPGDYQVNNADNISRAKPVESVFMTREARNSDFLIHKTAASHLGCYYPRQSPKPVQTDTRRGFRKQVKQIQDSVDHSMQRGIGVGDAYSSVPHSIQLCEDDLAVLRHWEALHAND